MRIREEYSLAALFEPRTVAVVGAGRERGRIGSEIFHNLVERFTGRVFPINPCAGEIEGVRAYARVTDVPEPIDLAVIAVPAAAVDTVLAECIAAGVGGVIVITAGFGETGADGQQAEARLRDTVRRAGMRMNCEALLGACGIRAAPIRIVATEQQAREAARELGYPVVMKGAGPAILHKTEAHAVYTDLADEAALIEAFRALSSRRDVEEMFLQQTVARGVEMFVGASLEPKFGHVVACGSGGTLLELMRDTSCRLAPLTDRDARDMLNEVRGAVRLRGYRGAAPLDERALQDVVLRVSQLLESCPSIAELDLNPVIVTADGATAVDVRVRVTT